jgi:hypothetical protein
MPAHCTKTTAGLAALGLTLPLVAKAQTAPGSASEEIARTAAGILGAALILDVLAAAVILSIHLGAAVYLRRRAQALGGPAWAWTLFGLFLGAIALAVWFSAQPAVRRAQKRSRPSRDAAPRS